MKINLIGLCLILTSTALKIEEVDRNRLVEKKENNRLNPFVLKGEADKTYLLTVNCTEGTVRSFIFNSPYQDLCANRTFKGSIAVLNSVLQSISFDIKEELNQLTDSEINYQISEEIDNEFTISYSLTQSFVYFKTIPFTVIDSSLIIDKSKEMDFDKEIIKISPAYLLSFKDHTYKLVFVGNTDTSWISYRFEGGSLFLSGKTPDSWKTGNSIDFYIEDQQNQLVSENITITPSLMLSSTNIKPLNIIILFTLSFSFICLVLILVILRSTRNKNRFPKLKLNKENRKQESPKNVLSRSILDWNNSVCERHTKKLSEDSSTPKGKKMLDWASDSEDDSFSTEGDIEDPNFSVDGDLSYISDYSHKNSFQSKQTKLTFFDLTVIN